MTADPKHTPAGAKNIWDVDDLVEAQPPRAAPSDAERGALVRAGERLGFSSREAPLPKALPPRPEPEYPDRITIRVRTEDKLRIEELAYQRRAKLGAVITEMLDLIEAQDKAKR